MTFLRTDPITGVSRGTVDKAYDYVIANNGTRLPEVRAYINELWRLCELAGFDFGLLFGQACDETGVFTSELWKTKLNPAGIGALETLDKPADIHYVGGEFTAATGAWAHVVHMYAYVYGDIKETHPLYEYKKFDPRFDAVLQAGYGGKATRLNYLDTRWAANPNYSAQIVGHSMRAFGAISYQPRTPSVPKEPTAMGMKKYRFVGLDKDVWLPDNIVVEIAIVPASVRNVRSNRYFTGQTSYTQHETANFGEGANAEMHKRWLHGGAGGSYVGFNFVVDDYKIIQLTPLNEVTWAAGTEQGNTYSYHTELCVNKGINHTVARKNAAALAGGLLAAKGWTASKMVQHNVWTGKNCPMLLRQNGLWPSFVNQVASFVTQAKAAALGTNVPTPAPAPKPVLDIVSGDYVKTIDRLNVRQGYGLKYPVVTVLDVDTQARVGKDGEGNYKMTADGYTWLNIGFDGGSGWAVADWLVEVPAPAAPTPEPVDAWPYPKPVVPSFWTELMKDGATHVYEAETLWVRVNDLYRVKNETDRLQLSIKGGEVVGPKLPVGAEFRGAAVGHSLMDNRAYVITPGLTRVALEDLEFVDGADEDATK